MHSLYPCVHYDKPTVRRLQPIVSRLALYVHPDMDVICHHQRASQGVHSLALNLSGLHYGQAPWVAQYHQMHPENIKFMQVQHYST